MSAPRVPQNFESAEEPPDVIVRRLVRALDYAEGFWLGFVKSNLPTQRRELTDTCRELLAPLGVRVIAVELPERIDELLPILREHLAREDSTQMRGGESKETKMKPALFISGLEHSIDSTDANPPILSYLNLNRELFRQQLSCPMVIWLPDYALTALVRRAPVFWAWRSVSTNARRNSN